LPQWSPNHVAPVPAPAAESPSSTYSNEPQAPAGDATIGGCALTSSSSVAGIVQPAGVK
jgi:hypothetical protein